MMFTSVLPLGLRSPDVNLKRRHQLSNVICQQRKLLIAYTCVNKENIYGFCKQSKSLNKFANNENILWYMQTKKTPYVIVMLRQFTKKVCKHTTCFLIHGSSLTVDLLHSLKLTTQSAHLTNLIIANFQASV